MAWPLVGPDACPAKLRAPGTGVLHGNIPRSCSESFPGEQTGISFGRAEKPQQIAEIFPRIPETSHRSQPPLAWVSIPCVVGIPVSGAVRDFTCRAIRDFTRRLDAKSAVSRVVGSPASYEADSLERVAWPLRQRCSASRRSVVISASTSPSASILWGSRRVAPVRGTPLPSSGGKKTLARAICPPLSWSPAILHLVRVL